MATVKRIAPGSAFKVGGITYAIMGLLFGILFALISMVGGANVPGAEAGVFRMFFGVGAIVFLPIFGNVCSTLKSVTCAFPGSTSSSSERNAGMFHWRFPKSYNNSPSTASAPTQNCAQKAGVADRYETIPGSAFEVDYGGPYDIALLTNNQNSLQPARIACRIEKWGEPGVGKRK